MKHEVVEVPVAIHDYEAILYTIVFYQKEEVSRGQISKQIHQRWFTW